MAAADPDSGPGSALGRRLRAHPWIKGLGLTLGMSVFFAAYFAVQNNPVYPVRVVPALALDHIIPFAPIWILPYFSLWAYVSLYPALLSDRRHLGLYATGAVGLATSGLAIFFFWPTTIEQPAIDWELHPLVAFLKTIDESGNACPSLHVAFAVFTAGALDRLLRETGARSRWRALNLLWGAAIVYATLATKQHVVLDAAAGTALGGLATLAHSRALRTFGTPGAEERRCPPSVPCR